MSGGRQEVPRLGVLFEKLKPGPGHSSQDVHLSQRRRLHAATVEIVVDRGYGAVTVRDLSRTAGVSTRAFYAHFANFEDCFVSTYRAVARATLRQIAASLQQGDDPEHGLRSGVRLLLTEIAGNPHPAHFVLVDSFDAGPTLRTEMSRFAQGFDRQILVGFCMRRASILSGQGAFAGIERVIRIRILEGREEELPELSEALCDWTLAFLGSSQEGIPPTSETGAANRSRHLDSSKNRGRAAHAFGPPGSERGRILAAVTKLTLKGGYGKLDAADVRREAGVSRRSFDRDFDSVDACFLAAVETLLTDALRRACRKGRGIRDRNQALRQIVDALCMDLAKNPDVARLGLVEILRAGALGVRSRETLISVAAAGLMEAGPTRGAEPELAGEAATAAVWKILQLELITSGATGFPGLASFLALVISDAASRGQVGDRKQQAKKVDC